LALIQPPKHADYFLVQRDRHSPTALPTRIGPNISPRSADVSVEPAEPAAEDTSTAEIAALVERAKNGDKDAFGRIYRLHRGPILRLARFHLGADADDAVAEVFLRAWLSLPKYRHMGAPFLAWLYGIGRHVIWDELSRRSRLEPRAEIPETAAWSEADERRTDDRLSITGAIASLPTEQRQVIEMKFFLGLTNPEVAAAMDTTIAAVNSKQWRALGTLRETLEQER
jgi:RNA polymerase sigma-70 factor, ECF subfamily